MIGPMRARRNLLGYGAAIVALVTIPASLLGSGPAKPRVRPHRLLAQGLRFPEGPVALGDGSVLVVEIARRTLTRIDTTGEVDIIAPLRGGPNGAAIGPDGACYICNNGGENFTEIDGVLLPQGRSDDYVGGWIERVDLQTGQAETLYEAVRGHRLSAPNDLVFDSTGGFWFTDIGKSGDRAQDNGGGTGSVHPMTWSSIAPADSGLPISANRETGPRIMVASTTPAPTAQPSPRWLTRCSHPTGSGSPPMAERFLSPNFSLAG